MKFHSKYFSYGILFLTIGMVSFLGSYFLNYFFEISDGAAYSKAYEKISSLDLIDGYENFIVYTGGAEPLSFLLFYSFSISLFLQFFLINGIFHLLKLFICLLVDVVVNCSTHR